MGCRHCRRGRVNRPRGLCTVCFAEPAVRALYPTRVRGVRAGVPDFNGTPPLPAPSGARQGTEEKIAVLAERAAARLALHHPSDGPDGGRPS